MEGEGEEEKEGLYSVERDEIYPVIWEKVQDFP